VSTELIRYDAMCSAIAAAYEVDEVKEIRDRAAALEYYARQSLNVAAERQCCEIRLRAERKAGELLRRMDKAKGAPGPGRGKAGIAAGPAFDEIPTLRDLGIAKAQSSQWQRLAAVPEPQFEAALAAPEKPTTNGIITAAAPPEITPVSDKALWLWGRLRDFGRLGLLAAEPAEVLSTMTPAMLADVRETAPSVVNWLVDIVAQGDC
jgi:hypothetical protein